MQCLFATKGIKKAHDEAAAFLVAEYIKRKALSEMGYTLRLEDLDILTAEAFVIIAAELQRLSREGGKGGRQGSDRTRGPG